MGACYTEAEMASSINFWERGGFLREASIWVGVGGGQSREEEGVKPAGVGSGGRLPWKGGASLHLV